MLLHLNARLRETLAAGYDPEEYPERRHPANRGWCEPGGTVREKGAGEPLGELRAPAE